MPYSYGPKSGPGDREGATDSLRKAYGRPTQSIAGYHNSREYRAQGRPIPIAVGSVWSTDHDAAPVRNRNFLTGAAS